MGLRSESGRGINREQVGEMPRDQRTEPSVARPGLGKSFKAVAARAREVLREKGYTEEQIDRELNRPRRREREE